MESICKTSPLDAAALFTIFNSEVEDAKSIPQPEKNYADEEDTFMEEVVFEEEDVFEEDNVCEDDVCEDDVFEEDVVVFDAGDFRVLHVLGRSPVFLNPSATPLDPLPIETANLVFWL